MQFRQGDAGDAELFGQLVEPFAQAGRLVLDHVDADVGVEHVLQH